MYETGVAVVESDPTVQSLVELHFGAGETEPSGLRRDVEAASFPLHNIVMTDHALVHPAADAVQIAGCGPPGGFGIARRTSEAAVVVGQESPQDLVGGVQIAGTGQTQFADQTILEDAPEAFDAALGLRTVGSDVGDAELLEGAAELGRLTLAGELFFHRPVVIVADEDTVAIAVEGQGNAAARKQAAEQVEIAIGSLGGEEFGFQDAAGGVVLEA